MAITAASVRAAHPEFASAADAVINPYIATAELNHDSEVWGDLRDVGMDLYVCDQLARSPFARDLRLQADDDTTVYQREWERLKNQVAHAYRVLP